jgi:diaminopimelate decarboxylase
MSEKIHHYPAGFDAVDGVMTVAGKAVTQWAREIGSTPFFLYDKNLIARRVAETRAAFPADIHLHYAMKANPMAAVVAHTCSLTDGLDVASGGELAKAISLGIDPAVISFAGPAKTDAELALALTCGVVLNAESESEIVRITRLARELRTRANVALRVNPNFEVRGAGMRMGGRAQPFGIDEDRVPAVLQSLDAANIDFVGFHIYAGSQNLNADLVIEAQANTVELVRRLSRLAPKPPRQINLGGGYGIPYFPGDMPLDIGRVGAALEDALVPLRAEVPGVQVVMELGRYLVGEAGVYVARVIDRKDSHGETFLVTDGGLHHQLAASGNFGQVIRRNYPVVMATRMDQPKAGPVTVVGCLCTPLDRLADRMALPFAEAGDLICVFQAGAYGLSSSPTGFLSHPVAEERLV